MTRFIFCATFTEVYFIQAVQPLIVIKPLGLIFMEDYIERQAGNVHVEYFIAMLLLSAVLVGGITLMGNAVSDKVSEIAQALPHNSAIDDSPPLTVSDEFLNQYGPTAAGPKDVDSNNSSFTVNSDGSIKLNLTSGVIYWGLGIFTTLLFSSLYYGFRRR